MLHACSSIHGGGWLGLVHQPLVREFASLESRRSGLKGAGVPGSEAVSPQAQSTARILNFDHGKRRGRGGKGGTWEGGGRGGGEEGEEGGGGRGGGTNPYYSQNPYTDGPYCNRRLILGKPRTPLSQPAINFKDSKIFRIGFVFRGKQI